MHTHKIFLSSSVLFLFVFPLLFSSGVHAHQQEQMPSYLRLMQLSYIPDVGASIDVQIDDTTVFENVSFPFTTSYDDAVQFAVLALFFVSMSHSLQTDQPDIWQPAPGTTWQWQLVGDINTSWDVDMYDIDLFDAPQDVINQLHEDGRIVICYFSAGSYEDWRTDAADFPAEILGEPLDEWPGERWLDIRQIDALAPIMLARLDLAVEKECDGVEPDNVDGYTNDTGFPLEPEDQLAYNRWLAQEAHARGLSIGLKNNLDQIEELVNDFDWALNEQCFEYDECELLLPFIEQGKAVFGVEYNLGSEDFCAQAIDMGFSWLHKTFDLADEPPGACLDLAE